jgi:hypothetical protein
VTFKLGKIFHLIQVTEDYEGLDAWYKDVFGAIRFTDGRNGFPYLEVEQRNATLITIASTCVEPISPAFEATGKWEKAPIGKFYQRFGQHWYSLAWHLDDPLDLYRTLRDREVRFFGQGGAAGEPTADDPLFTHPKDTVCALEFMDRKSSLLGDLPDPRFTDPGYDSIDWATRTPLGLVDLAYLTVTCKDLDRGKTVFVDWLGGDLLGESSSALTGTQDVYVRLGESVVQLSKPLEEGSLAGADVAKNGETLHAVAWQVRDLAQAKEFLASKGVQALDQDEHTLLADPAGTFGSYFRFTDKSVSGLIAQ